MPDLQIDTDELWELHYQLTKVDKNMVVPAAMASAMNRGLTNARKNTSKFVREQYALKAKSINETLKLQRANKRTVSASLESRGPVMSLSAFPVTPTKPDGGRRKVKVKVKAQGGKKEIKVKPGAFVGRSRNGQVQVFRRQGKSRLPIERLTTLSVPQMVSNEEVLPRIHDEALTMYEKRIHHEIDYRLSKIAKQAHGRGKA